MPEEDLGYVLSENPWLEAEDEQPPSEEEAEQLNPAVSEDSQPEDERQLSETRSVIELDPSDLYGSLRRLADSDPHFRNVLKSFSGRERQNELKMKVRELEKELERLRYEKSMALVQSASEEEIATRYQSDSAFREAYDYVANYSGEDDNEAEYEDLIEQTFDEADGWLPEARVKQYLYAMSPGGCRCSAIDEPHGIFDHDESGRPLSRVRAFARFRDTFLAEVNAAKRAYEQVRAQQFTRQAQPFQQQAPSGLAEQPRQQAVQPKPNRQNVAQAVEALRNPRLSANPDLSPGTVQTGDDVFTKEDIDKMSVDEIIRRWPNDGDFARDIEAGRVLIPGLNS